jgi:hypothetical protein
MRDRGDSSAKGVFRSSAFALWMRLVSVTASMALMGSIAATSDAAPPTAAPLRPLTSADAIATARFMPTGSNSREFVSISPDGRHYVVRLVRGDVERNGIWIDLWYGSLNSLEAAVPTQVAHLFSTGRGVVGYGGPVADGLAFKSSPLIWVGNEKVALLLSDKHDARQIVTVDLKSRRAVAQTASPTQKYGFDVAPNGTLVFAADAPLPPKPPAPQNGFVVPEGTDAFSIVEGYFYGTTINTRSSRAIWFVMPPHGPAEPVSFPGNRINKAYPYGQHVNISPDGSHAILTAPAVSVPIEWDRYAEHSREFDSYNVRELFAAARQNPTGMEARNIWQFYLLDVRSRVATPLWDAPAPWAKWQARWSPDGRLVALTPVPIPIAEQSDSKSDAQTVIFDVNEHKHWMLPVKAQEVQKVTWTALEQLRIESGEKRPACFELSHGDWESHACAESSVGELKSQPIDVRVKEDLNTPPTLVALDRTSGAERVILDPNPRLKSTFALGEVRFLSGHLSTGEQWNATLTLPVHYVPGESYPLVMAIQGGSVTADRFTLYGLMDETGLGPCSAATDAAQILAGRGIAVVTLQVQRGALERSGATGAGPADPDTKQRAFEEIAAQLISEHIADAHHLGINGFSRTGFYAIHTLSHSNLRFAAGVVSDNVDYSYMQVVLGNNYGDAEALIGAPAYGPGLRTWLDRATGFKADAIHAPLLLIGQSESARVLILEQWEILSLLRHLKRPVEMYLMPQIDTHPSHNPQNPEQVMAVQERAVDWFDFWLNGHEMPGQEKAAQYERWRRLRSEQIAAAGAAAAPTSSGGAP